MSVAVLVDSSSGITKDVAEKYHVRVVPLVLEAVRKLEFW